ncbi:unnamed protein product [Cyprideis torosa]|uniref:Uncharacterized protein n=1 Tax=Cyprideis torosa TaxID=163714 RepID=A0A7R8W5A6_9CRUS|nr:unnamed protein product [Cyprideis torosa]CAG0885049.1 unnamed protein product [Cyprideis torosa]
MAQSDIPKIMIFRPSWEEFKDFSKYVTYMESQGAHKAGLAKVIPPPEFQGSFSFKDIKVVSIKQENDMQYHQTVKNLLALKFSSIEKRYGTPKHFDFDDLERQYWENVTYVAPTYGADVPGTLTDTDVDEWNISRLGSILDNIDENIEGVNTPYLYFGTWKSTFPWHTEDMDLYSINYLHFGEPKFWYAVPPDHGRRLERMAQGFFTTQHHLCPAFLRHKMTVISPNVLSKFNIPYNKLVGFNIAEATNFALNRWVEYGKRATACSCPDFHGTVTFRMDKFVQRFQAERYESWKAGKDIGGGGGPIDLICYCESRRHPGTRPVPVTHCRGVYGAPTNPLQGGGATTLQGLDKNATVNGAVSTLGHIP